MTSIVRALLIVVAGGLLAVQVVRTAAVTTMPPGQRSAFACGRRTRRSWSIARWPKSAPAPRRGAIADARDPQPGRPDRKQGAARPRAVPDQGRDGAGRAAAGASPSSCSSRPAPGTRARWRRAISSPIAIFAPDGPAGTGEIAACLDCFPKAGRVRAGAGRLCANARRGAPLRNLFRSSPELEPLVLATLADDARNAELILALWGRQQWRADPADRRVAGQAHQQADRTGAVCESLCGLAAGRRRRATVGGRFQSRVREVGPRRRRSTGSSLPPAVLSSRPGNRLQVIYFGRNDAVLAEQVLLLAPGRYRLSMGISDPPGEGGEIAWTSLACLGARSISPPSDHAGGPSRQAFRYRRVSRAAASADRLARRLSAVAGFLHRQLRPDQSGRRMRQAIRSAVVPAYLLLCIVLGGSVQGAGRRSAPTPGDCDHRPGVCSPAMPSPCPGRPNCRLLCSAPRARSWSRAFSDPAAARPVVGAAGTRTDRRRLSHCAENCRACRSRWRHMTARPHC